MRRYQSIIIGTILSISGGLMDSYSYLYRGGTFANAQTGNIILFSVNLINNNLNTALYYLCPILCFIFGVAIASIINNRHLVILFEAIILGVVCLIPSNLIANSLISLTCGAQLESFDEICNHKVATTMCIGNLRNSIRYLCTREYKKALLYCWIIISFIAGAVLGSIMIEYLKQNTILICAALLLIARLLDQ